ncbi:MAG TPA: PQQ-binding-like beta-propeller repeat protein [Pirellulales bacterium]|jgi:outer membrane protein assembly factor BamB|nr:PQQ-binding-like beta-propeller repeat protein [Pirellulales bacterium]
MGLVRRAARPLVAILTFVVVGLSVRPAQSQFPTLFGNTRFELSGSVHVDELDSAAKQHLERVRALAAAGQWDDCIETILQVMERQGERVVAATPWRYTSVREHCHLLISRLPPKALALYRSRVDPQAEKWYRQGVRDHDAQRLLDVVEQMFVSSWADDALLALGEMALEQGDYGGARSWWDQLIETPPLDVSTADFERLRQADDLTAADAALLDRGYEISTDRDGQFVVLRSQLGGEPWTDADLAALARVFREHGQGSSRLAYPGSGIPLADIRARQIVLMILEGEESAAQLARADFARQYAGAHGRIAGREAAYLDTLTGLAESSRSWPRAPESPDWPTFAGSPERNKMGTGKVDLAAWKWKLPLPKTASTESGPFARRIAEDRNELLSYHPAVVDRWLLLNNANEIYAYDVNTGAPAPWGSPAFKDLESTASHVNTGRARLGVPRFTMTVYGKKLYARMGSAITCSPNDQRISTAQSYLICLDLARDGLALWDSRQSLPTDDKWAFEGSPVCDGPNVYVAMRRSDVHPQAHVACLDAQSGRLRWRRWICSAETPAQGLTEEITHNLLTLHGSTLYYNTNLGAVAALSTRDGQIEWLRLYPRSPGGDVSRRAAHFFRDLTPCVYDRGFVYVAPSDASRILALDAGTGELRWETTLAEDTVHLLGVCDDTLIATGDRIWWFNVQSGKPTRLPWPMDKPGGFGRGTIVDGLVYWPTRERIHVFRAGSGEEARQPIELARTHNALGGNLLVADGYFLIVTSDAIYGFEQSPPPAPPRGEAQARSSTSPRSLLSASVEPAARP